MKKISLIVIFLIALQIIPLGFMSQKQERKIERAPLCTCCSHEHVYGRAGDLLGLSVAYARDESKGSHPFRAVYACIDKAAQKIAQKAIAKATFGKLYPFVPQFIINQIPVPCPCSLLSLDSALTPFDIKNMLVVKTQEDIEDVMKKRNDKAQDALLQQLVMIKTKSPKGLDTFKKNYEKVRTSLRNANVLAMADNFDVEFRRRFPDYSQKKMSEKERETATYMRELLDAYMKAFGEATRTFDEEMALRTDLANRLVGLLTLAIDLMPLAVRDQAQTAALQFTGDMAAHSAFVIDRMNQYWGGFLEACVTCQIETRSNKETAVKNVTAIGQNASNYKPSSTKTFSLGL